MSEKKKKYSRKDYPLVASGYKVHKFVIRGISVLIDYSVDDQVDITMARGESERDAASFCYSEDYTTFCVGDGSKGMGTIRNVNKRVIT